MDKQEQLYNEYSEKRHELENLDEQCQRDIKKTEELRDRGEQTQYSLQACLRQIIEDNDNNAFYGKLEEYAERIKICGLRADDKFDENIKELTKEQQKINSDIDETESDYYRRKYELEEEKY